LVIDISRKVFIPNPPAPSSEEGVKEKVCCWNGGSEASLRVGERFGEGSSLIFGDV